MGKTGPTDVLSFPLLPPEAFARGAEVKDVPRPPRTRLHLGDVVVSVERAVEQASRVAAARRATSAGPLETNSGCW